MSESAHLSRGSRTELANNDPQACVLLVMLRSMNGSAASPGCTTRTAATMSPIGQKSFQILKASIENDNPANMDAVMRKFGLSKHSRPYPGPGLSGFSTKSKSALGSIASKVMWMASMDMGASILEFVLDNEAKTCKRHLDAIIPPELLRKADSETTAAIIRLFANDPAFNEACIQTRTHVAQTHVK